MLKARLQLIQQTQLVHDGSRVGGFPLAHENNPSFTGNVGGTDLLQQNCTLNPDSDAAKIRLDLIPLL